MDTDGHSELSVAWEWVHSLFIQREVQMQPLRRDARLSRRRGRNLGVLVFFLVAAGVLWLYQEDITLAIVGTTGRSNPQDGPSRRSGSRKHGASFNGNTDVDSSLPESDEDAGAVSSSSSSEAAHSKEAAKVQESSIQSGPSDLRKSLGALAIRSQPSKVEKQGSNRWAELIQGVGGQEARLEILRMLERNANDVSSASGRDAGSKEEIRQLIRKETQNMGVANDPLESRPGYAEAWQGRESLTKNEVASCEQALLEKDELKFTRDFNALPVRVHNTEVKRWDCDVPCEFTMDTSLPMDAGLGSGSGTFKVLRSMEASSYYGTNDPDNAHQSGYDIVMTVHYKSDVPVQYGSWEEYDIMKVPQAKDPSLAMAAAFISNCAATNFRLQALESIAKMIKVDSYGRCANNMGSTRVDKLETLMRYKFSLAFENSCEEDYVTEKFWQSLVAGAVPIVIGAPNIADFAPNNHSYFQIKAIEDVEVVAKKIQQVYQDERAWQYMVDWKTENPSDAFLANMDISTVHSSCRLCIHIADKLRTQEAPPEQSTRPCRCLVGSSYAYHIFVRERFTFTYTPIFLDSASLNLDGLKLAIQYTFQAKNHRPVWASKRPKVLATEKMVTALRIYRVYPAGLNQKDALRGDAWFKTDDDFFNHLAKTPCPHLEVIFV